MSTTKKRLPARASATLQDMIREAGPVGAATEALIWLGVGAAGLPLPPVGRREIARLMSNEALAPDVLAALQNLYDQPPQSQAANIVRRGSERDSANGTAGDTIGDTTPAHAQPSFKSAQAQITSEPSPMTVSTKPEPPSQIGSDWQEFDD